MEILNNNLQITELDVSEIDLSDEGFITFLDFLARDDPPLVPLTKLTLNYAFQKRGKVRPEAMRAVAKVVNSLGLKEFYFRGGKGGAVKTVRPSFISLLLSAFSSSSS